MNALALAIGGFFGTIARYTLDGAVPPMANGFPLGILIVNLMGCFLLGWLFTAVPAGRAAVRLGAGTGFLGAFTTFSTFSVQTVGLFHNGQPIAAVSYVLLSMIGGLALAYAGVRLGKGRGA